MDREREGENPEIEAIIKRWGDEATLARREALAQGGGGLPGDAFSARERYRNRLFRLMVVAWLIVAIQLIGLASEILGSGPDTYVTTRDGRVVPIESTESIDNVR